MVRWLAGIAVAFGLALTATPANACLWEPPYLPVFWSKPPLYTHPGEVVLRVRLKAKSEHIAEDGREEPFIILCGTHRSGLVFDIVEVLDGDFQDAEIAIISNDHYFFAQPEIGEARIVVGRIQAGTHVGQRYVVTDAYKQWLDHVEFGNESTPAEGEALWRGGIVGPPSQMAALQPRAPIELRVLFFFERPQYWILAGGLVLIAGLTGITGWAVLRRLKRPRP